MTNVGDCSKYIIHQTAYIKVVLHAVNHKTSAVNAVLLGRISGETVEITDSVPLFHSSNIGLLPPLEIALITIEEYYSAQGLSIVGYFHANERFDDLELGSVARNIADHVYRYFPQAAVLLLDNRKLGALQNKKDTGPVIQLYTRDSSKSWKQVESNRQLTTKEPSANIVLLDFISSEKWNDIVDFDDHLDDISKDWLNSGLFK
ncbi:ER membrane protein complex subunit 8/9 homolog [Bidens hawaiensis]|uniref:ER membrane protein complex subunit 8/9 homolog n=1 Tax=Bidens hawaiensis TaxID=980011 RepID=UPI00404B90A4